MSEDLYFAIQELVLEAGDMIFNAGSDKEVRTKDGPSDFVTKYDLQVQQFLIDHLRDICPGAAFLCEEGGYKDTSVNDGYTFIIDPIDGTTNFICDFRMSALSLALFYQGEAIMGFVLNPFSGELFTACKGKGAYLNGRRLRMKDRSLSEGVVICSLACYNPKLRDRTFSIAKAVSGHTINIRELGSASIGICYVACGRSVAYFSPSLKPWDYAAGVLIAKESGAVCCDWNGSAPGYEGSTSFLVSSEKGAGEYLDIIKDLS